MGTTTGEENPPNPPTGSVKEGYEWFFGDEPPPNSNETNEKNNSKNFKEGYEWFFE